MPKLKASAPIHDTLTGYDFTVDEALTPRKAMRKKCLECATTSINVQKCPILDCTLWPYRLGRGITSDIEGKKRQMRLTTPPRGLGTQFKKG